jgi:Nucleotide modification associated domain 1
MNRKEYMEFHQRFCVKMQDITQKKNADYAGDGGDAFANFRQIGGMVKVGNADVVAIGFLTRMSDKFSRIGSFITNGQLQVKDESVEDALLDLANYSALFAGYLRDKEKEKSKNVEA